jgi:hypothetical protein
MTLEQFADHKSLDELDRGLVDARRQWAARAAAIRAARGEAGRPLPELATPAAAPAVEPEDEKPFGGTPPEAPGGTMFDATPAARAPVDEMKAVIGRLCPAPGTPAAAASPALAPVEPLRPPEPPAPASGPLAPPDPVAAARAPAAKITVPTPPAALPPARERRPGTRRWRPEAGGRRAQCPPPLMPLTISSVIFLASPNSIMVLSW